MAHKLVVNRKNNLGDTICQFRGLKEYQEQHTDITYDFVTSEYLHCYAALHTDLFENIKYLPLEKLNALIEKVDPGQIIEFTLNWQRACEIGILKAWCEMTLGFIPSTDVPYFQIQPQEKIIAALHAEKLRLRFKKLVLLQFKAPSGYVRSFLPEDWQRLLDLFPKDIALIYPGPLDLASFSPMTQRNNLIVLPGYDIGTTAALIMQCDYVFGAHGGTIMLAHAVEKKEVTQVMFLTACAPNILKVPAWDNICFPSHNEVDWTELGKTINRRLT
jgi:hypothetical protein